MLSVQTNMLAENAARQFQINARKKEKNAEKLASGYKINRAADDAAGLSMSETMRRLVRGLQKGSENITEGISLIKVADASLGEIADMLQRINELSIKAYNETNTKQDRMFIQEEVDQLLEEIERTGEATTYNEIQVLKWEPSFTREVTIQEDQICTSPVTMTVQTLLPKWLDDGIDHELEKHIGYENLTDRKTGSTAVQDTSGTMVTLKKDAAGNIERNADGSAKYIYYGPNFGNSYGEKGAAYAGPWTPSLNNNATAKISYAGLTKFENTDDLYGGLIALLGGGFGIPCGTCRSKQYGINFTGEMDGIIVVDMEPYEKNKDNVRWAPNFNLTDFKEFVDDEGKAVNCFEKIKELTKKQIEDENLSEADKKRQVGDLAAEIAKKFAQKTYDLLSQNMEMMDHFTKSFLTNNYDIIVYDYRDETALSSVHAVDSTIRTWATAKMTYPGQYLEPGIKGTIEIPHDLYIVCSAQDSDDIPIELPYVSLKKLGIEGYHVGYYNRTETYSDSYKRKLADWEASAYEESVSYSETVPVHETKTEQVYIDGEIKVRYDRRQTGVKQITMTFTQKKYPYEKPKAGDGDIVVTEWYDPSNNILIKRALEQVSLWRTNLGATQNRLEHTYNNNGNKEENLTAAESRIRDTDIAREMVDYSNQNILQQAGVSMMTHANQDRQMILGLLQ